MGIPASDQPNIAKHRYPRYMLVGAFIPFSEKDAKNRYEQEVRDRQAMGLEGPVQMETSTKPNSQTLYFVELMAEKSDAPTAVGRMIIRLKTYISVRQCPESMRIGSRS